VNHESLHHQMIKNLEESYLKKKSQNLKYILLLFFAGIGMSPSSSNDKIGACIRSYFV